MGRDSPLGSTLSGRYWRERLHKRGHCFFLFLEHWVRHVAMAMGMQPGEELNWKEVPGVSSWGPAFKTWLDLT